MWGIKCLYKGDSVPQRPKTVLLPLSLLITTSRCSLPVNPWAEKLPQRQMLQDMKQQPGKIKTEASQKKYPEHKLHKRKSTILTGEGKVTMIQSYIYFWLIFPAHKHADNLSFFHCSFMTMFLGFVHSYH